MWLHNAMQSITVSRWKPQSRTTAANDQPAALMGKYVSPVVTPVERHGALRLSSRDRLKRPRGAIYSLGRPSATNAHAFMARCQQRLVLSHE